MVESFSHIHLFSTPWTVACQDPLSMGFSRQEYWSGYHFLLQGREVWFRYSLAWEPVDVSMVVWLSPDLCILETMRTFVGHRQKPAWTPTYLYLNI